MCTYIFYVIKRQKKRKKRLFVFDKKKNLTEHNKYKRLNKNERTTWNIKLRIAHMYMVI